MKKDFENKREEMKEDSVRKCELIANATNTLALKEKLRVNKQFENPCSYMGIIALETFIAELYINYMISESGSNISDNLSRTIENAIWAYDECVPFDEGIEYVKNVVSEHYGEIDSEKDILLLRLINYSNDRRSMAYYFEKAEELAEKYEWEIQQENDLQDRICELTMKDKNAEDAASAGRASHQIGIPKPKNPYDTKVLKQAWITGYELKRIEDLWKSSVNCN